MMMNKIILVLIVMVISNRHVFAQQKSQLSLSFGASVPVGSYAKKDTNSSLVGFPYGKTLNGSGLAKTGINLSLDYKYYLSDRWGLALQLKGQQNSVDANVIRQYSLDHGATTATAKSDSWVVGSIVAGGFYHTAIGRKTNKWEMQLKLMGGVLKTSIPGQTVNSTYSQQGNPIPIVAYSKRDAQTLGLGFAWQIGAQLLYRLSKKVSLIGGIDYSDASLHTTYHYVQLVNGNYTIGDPYTVHFGMGSININAGLGIWL
jgi:hypothetical protein